MQLLFYKVDTPKPENTREENTGPKQGLDLERWGDLPLQVPGDILLDKKEE
jgi:hypothetical protein